MCDVWLIGTHIILLYHMQLIYLLFGLIQNIWIHIWCLTSCGVRSASARAFNTCAREVREQQQARARDARANRGARAMCASKAKMRARVRARARPTRARANKLSKSGFGELICDLESLFARAESLFARARVGRSWPCSRTSRARLYLLARLARAPVVARAPRARTC